MAFLEIVCLANSRKIGGRCVAGLTRSGEWVRPVGPGQDGTLTYPQYLLDDGADSAVLDVIRIEVHARRPEPHQPENWVVAASTWQRRGHLATAAALAFLGQHLHVGPDLLGNSSDRVLYQRLVAQQGAASLAVIEPRDLRWHITTSMRGNRQTRAMFALGGAHYDLSVTDPAWEVRLASLAHGIHDNRAVGIGAGERVFLTISLGEPFLGDCYKLVAAVIVLAPERQ